MSSSLVLASDHSMTSLNLGEDLQTRNDHHRQTAGVRRSNGTTNGTNANANTNTRRKSSRANEGCKKKPPQRGMGVAQLERLRLQERWKKITQINPPCATTSTSSSPTTPPLLLSTGTLDSSLFAPESKAQFPKFHGFGNGVAAAAGLLQQQQQQQQQGFHGQCLVSADHHHDLLQGYLYGIGNVINNGNSKELPSTPKVSNCFTHDHCADCHKKKRTYTGENLMFSEMNKYANLHPVGGCDFTGLTIGVKGTDIDKKANLLQSGISSMGFCSTDPEVEAVAVEQKNKGISNGVTEYEFFPAGKGGYRSNGLISSSQNDQLLMMKKLMRKSSPESAGAAVLVMGGGEGSSNCFATTTTTTTNTTSSTTTTTTAPHTGGASVDASTSIDLSLRLSY